MQAIKELSLKELKEITDSWGKPEFHAHQIWNWIYKKNVTDFEKMSDLPLDLRRQLKENFSLANLKLVEVVTSKDQTKKFLFELNDGNFIEAVIIPAKERITGCISTQVGCKFSCQFCASGLLGFKRNLSYGEIIDEVLSLKASSQKLTNLVFMGIGEPLDNYDQVLKVVKTVNSPLALNLGARKITISTCGIIPGIKRLAEEGLQIELSVSLHAANEKIRNRLMPVNKKYPIKDLMGACREYIKKTNRQITFDYILINKLNSSLKDAQELSLLLKEIKLSKVNLIPANQIKELEIEPPPESEISSFKNYLDKAGIKVALRRPRGQDIKAACGQLRLSTMIS
ncbi:23S rRNA (adenine(2503)-C(2))-methyltransferase RlmN [bacterium]|nr:23S rRNA (adenine(2503)-C(2))-methyltransferase RlmN [bacterium]MBU1152603.1 23S rRNA (adenine(2503)-C(2))-methyltransferase RlmN [bacterium]MBU1782802.1 23S rRNA (adenine(2503)-C(2))-methyltransferase RlmN [bacterium]MBU2600295.1 23S rRNA (adenine(2503)-C(2))-methyltransferase RlmN [bacterium]